MLTISLILRSSLTRASIYQKMCSANFCSVLQLKEIFLKSVDAVLPRNLIRNEVKLQGRHLLIRGKTFELKKPCYMVGFGKAVLDMAVETERILGSQLQRAVVTIPVGIFKTHQRPDDSKIEFIEGGKNNLPDKDAMIGAEIIKKLAESLDKDDMLIVLISGGGSALLPLPIPPITLEEKSNLIKMLAKKGASINELNTIRKQISVVKGGGLARLAYPCKIVTLILSDIIGDPLDLIASSPTIPNVDSKETAMAVLKKYSVDADIPCSIKSVLENGMAVRHQLTKEMEQEMIQIGDDGEFGHVKSFIIGNNWGAARAAKVAAQHKGFQSAIVSTRVEGDVRTISRIYASLARHVVDTIRDAGNNTNKDKLRVFVEEEMASELRVRKEFIEELLAMDFGKAICLVLAGEPTVVVTGTGIGGRNQQLALSFSYEFNIARKTPLKDDIVDVSFLSCGTDGIDGPTDAAGAICDLEEDVHEAKVFLDNNDCYSFYQNYKGGQNLVRIEHTGTNVMDVHLMAFRPDTGKST